MIFGSLQSGFFGYVGERAVAVVVKQHVLSPESLQQIEIAVVVIIADASALSPTRAGDAGFCAHISECAVVIVVIQMTSGRAPRGEAFDR